MTDLDKNLAETWGPAAQHSEYKRGDDIRYRVPSGETYEGTVIWVTGPSDSHIEGRAGLALRYVVIRRGWSGFPDIVYSGDILTS
jgi:hypothetical protein